MTLKKRLAKIAVGSLIVGLAVAILFWFAGRAVENRLADLTKQAVALEMGLSFPARESNEEAERFRTQLDAFDRVSSSWHDRGISISSEDPSELKVLLAEAGHLIPAAYGLSNCEAYGKEEDRWQGAVWVGLQAMTATMLLTIDGNRAIANHDLEGLLKAASAIRRIIHLAPLDEQIACGTVSTLTRDYCSLLQRGAETFDEPPQIERIVAEVKNWRITSFDMAAAHLAASEFRSIDRDAETVPQGLSPTETVRHVFQTTKPAITKRKMFALNDAIQVYQRWSYDAYVLDQFRSAPSVSLVPHFAGFLKFRELELRAYLASLWATLHARRAIVDGRPPPTIAQLAALGVQVKDPISGVSYELRDFEGNLRLFGTMQAEEGPPRRDFFL